MVYLNIFLLTMAVAFGRWNNKSDDPLRHPDEKRLSNIKQLTFGGENAEAYFSFDGKSLVFQSTREPFKCDQIFTMSVDGSEVTQISNGLGRTTCAYYLPGDSLILYSSTHEGDSNCPPKPDMSMGYVWAIYNTFDIYIADINGNLISRLSKTNSYDAEATVSPMKDKIVFTSTRNGDLDIFTMNIDGTDIKQLTNEPGYDGGAFFSHDGTKIVYRRSAFESNDEIKEYETLLSRGLVKPSMMEIWIMDSDGSNKMQVTDNGAANFAPFFTPDDKQIIFSSNLQNPHGREFDIYLVNLDGTGLERVTFTEQFDGFPMFSPDGTKLVFCSNRNSKDRGETNVFICDWVK
ncbi:hypothetical protein FBQ84_05840 [Ignavibacteria bacterium CHB1]|jgi:Tol biopolymer transport system component|nr:MAG: hypothetical protein EDM69_08420 [Chlorobiota bacterium]KXK03792.1 MAG: TolB protein [Chlorobi bacterium OLB4]MBV6398160.1 Protein TolB [Ignavibacteria bacterium]MCE7953414.1 hypothetical protein [Chlorobi bacterium CHB7]MDL1887350.1 hypothetical protein [Ignavibacteria bacterium CHB1]OQY78675.1 MAG: hypothetical protein B6D43_01475 [Ignavibacteriales bacterium UTCHB1]RIK48714.1 MAG: hypothetical protein DCC60_06670 [Ignavibacteriota bacterium]